MNYINSSLLKPFRVLSIEGSYKLIGSRSIANLLYANDYDLNETLKLNGRNDCDKIYHHFLEILDKCHREPDYYILNFKCGETEGEPIRWTYKKMKAKKKLFIKSIEQNATIKIDLCFVLDGEFIEITNNYTIHKLHLKGDLGKVKRINKVTVLKSLHENIDELIKEKSYFKALKRIFSCDVIKQEVNEDLLQILNSDYGRFYKTISDLDLVLRMTEQKVKPVPIELLKANLERIKQFTSNIALIEVGNVLTAILKIHKLKSKSGISKALTALISLCEKLLNKSIKKKYKKFLH